MLKKRGMERERGRKRAPKSNRTLFSTHLPHNSIWFRVNGMATIASKTVAHKRFLYNAKNTCECVCGCVWKRCTQIRWLAPLGLLMRRSENLFIDCGWKRLTCSTQKWRHYQFWAPLFCRKHTHTYTSTHIHVFCCQEKGAINQLWKMSLPPNYTVSFIHTNDINTFVHM